jgi:hypothetical protein
LERLALPGPLNSPLSFSGIFVAQSVVSVMWFFDYLRCVIFPLDIVLAAFLKICTASDLRMVFSELCKVAIALLLFSDILFLQ